MVLSWRERKQKQGIDWLGTLRPAACRNNKTRMNKFQAMHQQGQLQDLKWLLCVCGGLVLNVLECNVRGRELKFKRRRKMCLVICIVFVKSQNVHNWLLGDGRLCSTLLVGRWDGERIDHPPLGYMLLKDNKNKKSVSVERESFSLDRFSGNIIVSNK